MLRRILTLVAVLILTLEVSAQVTPAERRPSLPQPTSGPPAQQPPHPAGDIARIDASRNEKLQLLQQKSAELDRLQREIKQLREATGTAQQVLVKVQMLEVNLTKVRQLGMDVDWFANGSFGGAKPLQLLEAAGAESSTPSAEPAVKSESSDRLRFVDALKTNHLAKVLAEPNVVVVRGRPGSFNVGGEIPVPSKDGAKAAVDFQKFGTQVDLLAIALGDNRVRLEIRTRVSELDDGRAIEIGGVRFPGMMVRECATARKISFGQSAILTGLVQQRAESILERGELKEVLIDVGLLVVVTPELIDPLDTPANANRDVRANRK